MKATYKRGFTLIELLVVIAIIGLLAAVVLASVGSARSKGADAAVKSGLDNMRSQAELYASDNSNSYDNVCTTNAAGHGIKDMLASAASTTGAAIAHDAQGATKTATCNDSSDAWAAQAPLTSGSYWCVDSDGASSEESTAFASGTTYSCPTS